MSERSDASKLVLAFRRKAKPKQSRAHMIKVFWRARMHEEDIPMLWKDCPKHCWWVLGSCEHLIAEKPVAVLSLRREGPVVIPCYECKEKKNALH